jgi:hypothetical protein
MVETITFPFSPKPTIFERSRVEMPICIHPSVSGGESGLVVSVGYLLTLYYFHEVPVVSSVKAPTMIQERKRARE